MKKINYSLLAFCLFIPLAAGVIGSFFTYPSIKSWYSTLQKPFFNPPDWIFGPVWTILYTLMGLALYLVITSQNKINKTALLFFSFQLILNSFWSILFFGFRSPLLAMLEIIVLWLMILLTVKSFIKIRTIAGYILFPYLAWVSFAALLNLSVVLLNP